MEFFDLEPGQKLTVGDVGTISWAKIGKLQRTRLLIDAGPEHSVTAIRYPEAHTQRLGLAKIEEADQIASWDDGHPMFQLDADDVRKLIRDPWVYCAAFRLNGRAVAFAALERHKRAVAVERVIVDPEHRRKGFGDILLAHVRDMLDRRRRKMAVCAVPEVDHVSIAWLMHAGYGQVGIGRDEGVILMGRRYF